MEGTTLYPLNRLKDVYPKAWEEQVKKYEDREHMLEVKIPPLDCLWNDVLHMSPVHPVEIYEVLKDFGFKRHPEFFEIDSDTLEKENLAIYAYEDTQLNRKDDGRKIIPYDEAYILSNNKIRQITKDYFKKCQEEGKIPMTFVGVPHVLYKGSIDVKNAKIIKI